MERRKFIKNASIVAGTIATIKPAMSMNLIQDDAKKDNIVGHGTHRYKVDKDWGVQDFSKYPVKNCHEMVQSKDGRLFMVTDEHKNNVLVYDLKGNVIKSWTHNFKAAHGLTITEENGKEYLFITCLWQHKVIKTTLDGKVVMTLKHPIATGLYRKESQYAPSETAIAPNGDIYVVDGYGLQYIIKYSSKGEILDVYGGIGGGKNFFPKRWDAHGLCFDYREDPDNPMLVVAQRMANKFKWMDLNGNFIKEVSLPGVFVSRPVIKGDNLYTAVLGSEFPWENAPKSGFVCILDKNNKVISAPGAFPPIYNNKKLQRMKGDRQHFIRPHDVCIDQDENIYVCQWNSNNTYPIKLERI